MPTLLLVRHARAGKRGTGPQDLLRPLDERGIAQAARLPGLLVPLLASTPTSPTARTQAAPHADAPVVASSPAHRCIATVEPLAAALGVTVEIDPALVEGSDARVLEARIATLTRTTVWSSHGDVIPELLTMLARRGVDLGPSPRCPKAGSWVLDVRDGAVVRARFVAPPD